MGIIVVAMTFIWYTPHNVFARAQDICFNYHVMEWHEAISIVILTKHIFEIVTKQTREIAAPQLLVYVTDNIFVVARKDE